MKFGFIGAGNVAQTYAKHFVRHGHEVVLSNSKGPDSLVELVGSIGPNAKAGVVKEAAKQDIVLLAVRWEQAKQALAEVSDWNADAKRKLARALEETGFVPVDIGGLIDGGKLHQFGGPLNALHLDLLNRMRF